MSAKIYNAFRFHNRHFPALPFALREKAASVARKKISAQYDRWIEAANNGANAEAFRKELVSISSERCVPKTGVTFTKSDASHVLSVAYKNQFSSHLRNTWDLNASLTFRQRGNYWYMLAYSGDFYNFNLGKGSLFDFLSSEKKLSEYGYWNNVDAPPGITKRQWKARADNWNPLLETKNWGNYLIVEIVSVSNFYQVDPAFNR